jgi:hypothetical protein
MKKIFFISLLVIFSGTLLTFGVLHAQQENSIPTATLKNVDYKGAPITDTDMDGLTNEGEVQVYGTDSNKADTDGDGWSDGVEVLSGTDPLDPNSYPGAIISEESPTGVVSNETSWSWYISRASGIIGFLLLYVSMFLGLTIRIPFLRKYFAPLYALEGHCFIALQATIFALLHGTILMLDKFMKFTLTDVFVPFSSHFEPGFVALGTLGFYLMVMLTITSYARRYLSQKLWRILHFTNIGLYVIVVIHAFYLGTDIKVAAIRSIFIGLNAVLALLILTNIVLRTKQSIEIKRRASESLATAENQNENI